MTGHGNGGSSLDAVAALTPVAGWAASMEAFELARCAPPLIATVDAATAVPRPSHLMSRRPRRGTVTVDPVDPILAAQMRNRSLVEEASGCPVVSGA